MQKLRLRFRPAQPYYLARQYKTIAMVGVVLAILIGLFLKPSGAIGFIIRGRALGRLQLIGMNVSVRQRTHGPGCNQGIGPALDVATSAAEPSPYAGGGPWAARDCFTGTSCRMARRRLKDSSH
jgi:Na+/H+-translocating membrane pyrophosphatase